MSGWSEGVINRAYCAVIACLSVPGSSAPVPNSSCLPVCLSVILRPARVGYSTWHEIIEDFRGSAGIGNEQHSSSMTMIVILHYGFNLLLRDNVLKLHLATRSCSAKYDWSEDRVEVCKTSPGALVKSSLSILIESHSCYHLSAWNLVATWNWEFGDWLCGSK